MAVTIFKLAKPQIVFRRLLTRSLSTYKLSEKDVEEVQIPVSWGHIAGKWWGDKNKPPVVAIHGWQDNANSFDKLIPLLNLPSVLAIDLPGHGISSHFPEGMMYNLPDLVMALHRVKMYFGWPSMPLLTHSFGAALAYNYAAVFPSEVKWLISIECMRSVLSLLQCDYCSKMALRIEDFLTIEKNKAQKLNPSYKLSQLISMYMEGSCGSISHPEKALILLKRGLLPSESTNAQTVRDSSDMELFLEVEKRQTKKMSVEEQKDMQKYFESLELSLKKAKENLKNFNLDQSDDKYFTLKRDPSAKILAIEVGDEEFLLKCAETIKCPVLSVRAKDGFLNGSTKKLYERTLDTLKSSYLEHHDIDGTHHVHLWKWWGPRDKQPILCVHGWQDNANSFDSLIPQLPSEFSYLAIDNPGHGFSSHIPKGVFYKTSDILVTFRRIQEYFQWKKLTAIGHSLGAVLTFVYSSVFPNDVNFIVLIDSIKPLSRNIHNEINNASDTAKQLLKYDSLDTSTAVGYRKEDLIKLWIQGTNNSLTEKSCNILFQRAVTEKNGLFALRRDPKLKKSFLVKTSHKSTLDMAKNLSCNVLYIKAADTPYLEKEQYVFDVVDIIKKKAKYFEEHKLPGTHHLHLNNPEVVAPVIGAFIKSVSGG